MEHCRFVSCDTSTKNSAMALFIDGKYQEHCLYSLPKCNDVEKRIDLMIIHLWEQLDKWQPNELWIEHPQGHGSNVSMVNKLSEILGAIRGWCLAHGCSYHEIMPSQWRKYCGIAQGHKNRDDLKQASVQYIKDALGIDEGDDVADSIALGYGVINYFNTLE